MKRKLAAIEIPEDEIYLPSDVPVFATGLDLAPKVPLHWLRLVTRREGQRGPKYVKPTSNFYALENYTPKECGANDRVKVDKGNLDGDDYRFFRGVNHYNGGEQATCRWCYLTFYSKQGRRDHLKGAGCSLLLRKLYEYSWKVPNPVCMTCGFDTKEAKWGMPLCNKFACISQWKFNIISEMKGFIALRLKAVGDGSMDDLLEMAEKRKKENATTTDTHTNP